jgi:bifunctional non-homologous end joining protein LigD
MRAPDRSYAPFDSADFLYEIKFDGYRGLARVEKGQARLFTKSRMEVTTWFPEIVQGLSHLKGGTHILDGEICVLDKFGRSDFWKLRERASRRRLFPDAPLCTYMAFDITMYDGQDVMDLPLVMRKEILADILAPLPRKHVMFVKDFDADASLFPRFVLAYELEGFVAKRKASTYQPGVRSSDWRKIKRKGRLSRSDSRARVSRFDGYRTRCLLTYESSRVIFLGLD